jgi:hypothetical protein
MNERPSAGSGVVGYLLVLVGVAAFVLKLLLALHAILRSGIHLILPIGHGEPGRNLEDVGGLLLLFGGTTTVAWVALRWTPTWPTRALADALDPSSRHRYLVLVVDRRSSQCVGTL